MDTKEALIFLRTHTRKKNRKYLYRHPVEFITQWIDNEDQEFLNVKYVSNSKTLIKFSFKMRNCIFDFIVPILMGVFQVYIVEVKNMPLALLLGGSKDAIDFVDCKGKTNVNLNIEEMYHLSKHLRKLGVK